VRDATRHGRVYSFDRGELASPGDRFWDIEQLPGKERLEIGKKRNIVYVNNGNEGWELDRQGVRDQTPEQVQEYQESNRRALDYMLRFRVGRERIQLYYLGTSFADNRRVHVLELVDEGGESLKVLADERTYLPLQTQYRQRDALSGEWQDVIEYYGNYVSVQGVQTPKNFSRERGGRRILEVYVSEVQYNTGVSESLFTRESLDAQWSRTKKK